MNRVLFLLLLFSVSAMTALAENPKPGKSPYAHRGRTGYFFLPSRALYYYQPQRYPPYSGYYAGHYGAYGVSRASRRARASVIDPYVGAYPQHNPVYRLYVQSPYGNEVVQSNSSDVIFKVDPPQALVYIDDKLIGSARDFATERDRYNLLDGEHQLRIEYPGYEPFDTRMEVVPNKVLHLDIELAAKD